MQGPDLNNRLDAVLLHFRKESIALVADVEAMCHQVLVSPRDQDSLRFLWWRDGDFTKEAIPHRVKVHLFGATSSPSCAAFSLRQAALDFGDGYEPLVVSTVERAALCGRRLDVCFRRRNRYQTSRRTSINARQGRISSN